MKFSWFFKGIRAVSIIMGKLPVILEDGKVTIDEMVDLITALLQVFDVPVAFDLPDELTGQVIGARLDV